MSFLDKYRTIQQDLFYQHLKPETVDRYRTGEPIDTEEFQEMRLNSYESRFLFPLLKEEVKDELLRHAIAQDGIRKLGGYQISSSYRSAILNLYLFDLIERNREKAEKIKKLKSSLRRAERTSRTRLHYQDHFLRCILKQFRRILGDG